MGNNDIVKTEKEFGRAIKNHQDEIVIEGDLINKVIRIRATGRFAWKVAVVAIGAAVVVFLSSGGTGAPVSAIAGVGATAVLGGSATAAAVSIAIAAGGVGALNSLRQYREISRESNKLVLKRK